MGRVVEDVAEPVSTASLKHNEALGLVRQGLSDLAQSLDEMDRSSDIFRTDQRVGELNGRSRVARDAREKITEKTTAMESDMRKKFVPLRASMEESKLRIPVAISRNSSLSLWIRWALCFQILVAILMYWLSTKSAQDLFLTTYHDPFYPDLHLYVVKPDLIRHSRVSSSLGPFSLVSLSDTVRHNGLKAAATSVLEGFAVVLNDIQKLAWERWGSDDLQRNASWPPT